MFCDKHHVNQLVSLLNAFGIRDVVVCPGARNAIIIHDLAETEKFTLYPVTDERSAAFVALGISDVKDNSPVALCVTSGSALLNTLPAVSEAYYRQVPLFVISADRPPQWIGQLVGQTIEQVNALSPYARTYQLVEDESNGHYNLWNNRMINEACNALIRSKLPVHLNVPLKEPLFSFHTKTLPTERVFTESKMREGYDDTSLDEIKQLIQNAHFPILLVGQLSPSVVKTLKEGSEFLKKILVISEVIGNIQDSCPSFFAERLLEKLGVSPDLVVQIGGNFVDRKLVKYIRNFKSLQVVRIETGPGSPDTFGRLTALIRTENLKDTLSNIFKNLEPKFCFSELTSVLTQLNDSFTKYHFSKFCDLAVVHALSCKISRSFPIVLHLANSSSVRNASYFTWFTSVPKYCNRGVNGIEGSLSTAVGHALAEPNKMVITLIGDLSFFYDNNALFNPHLKGNLRIILFNNKGGQIFQSLPGLSDSPILDTYVVAPHHFSAKGLAESYCLKYLSVEKYEDLDDALPTFLDKDFSRPVLLEVFTSSEDNELERKKIIQYITHL